MPRLLSDTRGVRKVAPHNTPVWFITAFNVCIKKKLNNESIVKKIHIQLTTNVRQGQARIEEPSKQRRVPPQGLTNHVY